jgi:hypothetical protein
MNGAFEKNDAYPYTVAPEGGYDAPTGRWVIKDIRDGKQVGSKNYPDAVQASLQITRIKQGW